MLTVTKDGNKIIVANEGEPNDDYTVDPEGSVAIIDISNGVTNLSQSDVKILNFKMLLLKSQVVSKAFYKLCCRS